MIEEDIAFVVISGLTIGAAIVSLESKQVVYGAIALAFSFIGIAGLFILLDATFVALFQVIVYVGAIAVLILFTVMLVTKDIDPNAKREPTQPAGIILAVIIIILVGAVASISSLWSWAPSTAYSSSIVVAIGDSITSQYMIPLEVLALILGASIVGAITLAKLDRE